MMTSALDTNAVLDKSKHNQEKPTRHCIFMTFKDMSYQSINSPIMPEA